MNGFYLRFAAAWLVSMGVGCMSAPVRYYTLTPPPDKAWSASDATMPIASVPIDVRIVHIPPQVNSAELMVRAGPSEMTLLENERWASPVKDEIKDALRLELQRRLGRMSGLHPSVTKLTLDIDVQHLEAELGRSALLDASWSATLSVTDAPATGAREATCTFHAEERIRAGYAGLVDGYQREIAALADAIAAVLTSSGSGIEIHQCGVKHVSPSS